MRYDLTPEHINEFWSLVDSSAAESSCWPWLGKTTDRHGYGQFYVRGQKVQIRSHRVAAFLAYGAIPDGMVVAHSCDNPSCCNPAHLRVTTQRENVYDMIRRGRDRSLRVGRKDCWPKDREQFVRRAARNPRGEGHGLSKLTEQDVRNIRDRYARGGVTYAMLGREYGLTETGIMYIIKRKNWAHVK